MIYVMLPAYNEELGIGSVLDKIKALAHRSEEPWRVIVVDDGSLDRTREVVGRFSDRLDLKIFGFERNQGVAAVFKKGLQFIIQDSKNPEEDICLTLDSDNTQDPRTIPVMIETIRKGNDLVIASRFVRGGGMVGVPAARQVLSYGASYLMRWTVGLEGVRDYSTLFRAVRVSLLQKGFEQFGDHLLAGSGFAAGTGLLIRLGSLTERISEVPLLLRYDFKKGKSGMRILKTIRGYWGLMAAVSYTHLTLPTKRIV